MVVDNPNVHLMHLQFFDNIILSSFQNDAALVRKLEAAASVQTGTVLHLVLECKCHFQSTTMQI